MKAKPSSASHCEKLWVCMITFIRLDTIADAWAQLADRTEIRQCWSQISEYARRLMRSSPDSRLELTKLNDSMVMKSFLFCQTLPASLSSEHPEKKRQPIFPLAPTSELPMAKVYDSILESEFPGMWHWEVINICPAGKSFACSHLHNRRGGIKSSSRWFHLSPVRRTLFLAGFDTYGTNGYAAPRPHATGSALIWD